LASIKKISDRKFKITVSNGYRPDGRKICRAKTIIVPDSVSRRGISQYVSHAAEEIERTVKNGFCEDAEMTFEEYARRWLDRQVKYAPGTLASYRRMLQKVYPLIGEIQLGRLRPMALENMLVELRKRESHGKPVQEATVQKYLTVVSAVLSDAKRNEIIAKNPARMIDLPDTEKREQFIPTEEQAEQLIVALLDEEWVYKAYYILAIYTGCRRGELCALKWDDFRFFGRRAVLTVSRSRSVIAGGGVQEGRTKKGRNRTIAIEEDTTSFLLTYYCIKRKGEEQSHAEHSPYLFRNEESKPVHPDTFTKHLRQSYRENDFPDSFHLHTLRHLFITTLLHHGVDKQTVVELVGHADTSFLERTYCHPQMDLKNQAADVMGETLFRTA